MPHENTTETAFASVDSHDIDVLPPEFLTDPHRRKGDLITAARLISLGVVSEQQAAAMLRAAYKIAFENQHDSRAFKRAADVIFAATRLHLQAQANEIELEKSRTPQLHGHVHYDQSESVRFGLAKIAAKLGITGVD